MKKGSVELRTGSAVATDIGRSSGDKVTLKLLVVVMDKQESAELAREIPLSDLQSPDEPVRTRAPGSLCPCRNDWELFEQHVKSIYRLTKNPFFDNER